MDIKSIPLSEATEGEKRAFATEFLNLEVAADADDAALTAAIERAQPGIAMIFAVQSPADEPVLNEPGAEAPPAEVVLRAEEAHGKQVGSLGKGDPRWVIEIPVMETKDSSGSRDVLVGVNGRAWQLKRGVPLPIPHRVKLALDNAEATVVRHDEQGTETRRQAKRFPYQVHEMPSPQAIAAWHERVDNEFCA